MKNLFASFIGASFAFASFTVHASEQEISLSAGNYIIEVQQKDACSTNSINVAKDLEFNNLSDMTVKLKMDGYVYDNLMRAAVCIPGVSVGKIFLKLKTDAVVKTVSEDAKNPLTLRKVSLVTETESVRPTAKLKSGDYVVDVSTLGACRDLEINIKQRLEYLFSQEGKSNKRNIYAAKGSYVGDNRAHTMICRMVATNRGSAVVSVPALNRFETKVLPEVRNVPGNPTLNIDAVTKIISTDVILDDAL